MAKYYSIPGNYRITYKTQKDGKVTQRFPVQFHNHYFETLDKQVIEFIEEDIKLHKERKMRCDMMTIDERELMKAHEVEHILVEGKKYSTKELLENADKVKSLEEEIKKLKQTTKPKQ